MAKQGITLIDCEAVGGKWNFITEVFVLVCSYEPPIFMPLTGYHTLVKIPARYRQGIRKDPVCQVVYRQLTGLSLQTLGERGVPYRQAWQEVTDLVGRYSFPIFARDPTLESKTFQRNDIYEVLTLLHPPFDSLYYYKRSRPATRREDICEHHEFFLAHPHCARADVFNMLRWINRVGRQNPYALVNAPALVATKEQEEEEKKNHVQILRRPAVGLPLPAPRPPPLPLPALAGKNAS